jgi:NAD(P)H-dependent FMN reductase
MPAMTTPTPLLVFAGSTRAQSFNRKLATVAAELGREAGAAVTHIELADFDVPLYNADLEAQGTPRDVVRLKELFFAHPAWIVVSPEYNGSYTGLMKNTIDWVSPRQFALSKAGEAFTPDGQLAAEPARENVRAVVDQVLWAARRFQG